MMKKLLAAVCSAILVIGMAAALPENAAKAVGGIVAGAELSGDFRYGMLDDGTAEITGYVGSDKNVDIPSSIDGAKVTRIGEAAFNGNTSITSVDIPKNVIAVGAKAFNGCTELAKVTLPDGIKVIDEYAFCACSSLDGVKLPDSLEKLGDLAFHNCSALSAINIPSKVSRISNFAFVGGNSLADVKISEGVTVIGQSAFNRCIALKAVDIPSSVTTIENSAFSRCSELEKVDIPENVNYIGANAFFITKWLNKQQEKDPLVVVNGILIDGRKCSGNIVIPDSVSSIAAQAFYGCQDVREIILPDSITSIGYSAFFGCFMLKSINLPDGIDEIGDYTFEDCESLTEIVLPQSVTKIGQYAFSDCEKLASINIPDAVTSIGDNAFSDCKNIKQLSLSENIDSIGDKAIGYHYNYSSSAYEKNEDFKLYCFKGTAAEKYAEKNELDYESSYRKLECTAISLSPSSYIYDGKAKYPKVTLVKGNYTLTQGKDYSLQYKNNVEIGTASVVATGIGDFVGELTIDFAINDPNSASDKKCGDDLEWKLSDDGTLTISGTGAMYNFEAKDAPWYPQKDNIKKLVISEGVVSVGENAFISLDKLTTVKLPDTLETLGDYAFCDDFSLTELNIPKKLKNLGQNSLANIPWLENMRNESENNIVYANGLLIDATACEGKVTVPEGIERIGGYSFRYAGVTGVELQKSVKSIENMAFEQCTELKEIVIPESVTFIYSEAFRGCSDELCIIGKKGSYADIFAYNHDIKFKQLITDISNCEVSLDKEKYLFEGSAVEPKTTVRLDGIELTRGIDYNVEYSDNDKVGTATVTVIGIGNYGGTAAVNFDIVNEVSEDTLGDVNRDGIINVSDISKVAAHIKGIRALEKEEKPLADINGDGNVNVMDISKMAAHVKGVRVLG